MLFVLSFFVFPFGFLLYSFIRSLLLSSVHLSVPSFVLLFFFRYVYHFLYFCRVIFLPVFPALFVSFILSLCFLSLSTTFHSFQHLFPLLLLGLFRWLVFSFAISCLMHFCRSAVLLMRMSSIRQVFLYLFVAFFLFCSFLLLLG